MIIGVAVAVVAIGGLFLLFGKDNPIADIINPTPPPGTFVFATVTSAYEATAVTADKEKLQSAAKQATPDVQAVITELFQKGYVDPSGWGDAGAIDDLFTGDAKAQVEPNVDTLTLGAGADGTVTAVDPRKSKLKVTVLTDADGNVTRAMAQPTFAALAANEDGTYTDITVTGTLFLVPTGDGWRIEAFGLNREQKPGEAPPTSSSPSPSESA